MFVLRTKQMNCKDVVLNLNPRIHSYTFHARVFTGHVVSVVLLWTIHELQVILRHISKCLALCHPRCASQISVLQTQSGDLSVLLHLSMISANTKQSALWTPASVCPKFYGNFARQLVSIQSQTHFQESSV